MPAERLDQEIEGLATHVAARSARVIALGKAAFYRQSELDLEAAYALASEAMTSNLQLADAAEGMNAFLGKRMPVWPAN